MFGNKKIALALSVLIIGIFLTGFWVFSSGNDPDSPPEEIVKISVTETAPPSMNRDSIRDTGDVWVELLENAENTVYIGAYYLQESPGDQWRLSDIYNALRSAADRGVKVRILVDSSNFASGMVTELEGLTNIEIRSWAGDGVLHSKYIIVDERIISLGSTNLSYYAMQTDGGNREVNLTIEDGELLQSYTYIFETGWEQAGGEAGDSFYSWEENWIIPVADGTGDDRVLKTREAYRKIFDEAENQVNVYTYIYAGMPTEMSTSMEEALDRGVEMRFLVDDTSVSEHPDAVDGLDEMPNVDVFVIDHPRSAHAKLAIADEKWCYVGSSNIHPEWMYEGRQIGVLLESEDIAEELITIYRKDWISTKTSEY